MINFASISNSKKKTLLKLYQLYQWVALLSFILVMTGCALSAKGKSGLPSQKEKWPQIKKIAVLPFYNISDRLDAEILVTNIIIGEILNDQRFSVVKYGDIQQFLLQQRIRSTETVTGDTLKSLADTFSADAVLLGTINLYREWDPDNDKEPAAVEISARLLDCNSGQILWFGSEKKTGWDQRTIFEIGEIKFCSQLVKKIALDFLKELRLKAEG